jgi:multifunctional beta-oxidation protein
VNHIRLLEVLDKGKAAAVTVAVDTVDKTTGKLVFETQSTVFLRGSGGFGGQKKGSGALPCFAICPACASTDWVPWL